MAKIQGKMEEDTTAADKLEFQPTNDAVGVRAVLRRFQKMYMEEVGKEQFRIATSTDGKVGCIHCSRRCALAHRVSLLRASIAGQICRL